jgi:hypothetical protein
MKWPLFGSAAPHSDFPFNSTQPIRSRVFSICQHHSPKVSPWNIVKDKLMAKVSLHGPFCSHWPPAVVVCSVLVALVVLVVLVSVEVDIVELGVKVVATWVVAPSVVGSAVGSSVEDDGGSVAANGTL